MQTYLSVCSWLLPSDVDGHNCGLLWVTFIYDFIISQQWVHWHVTKKVSEWREEFLWNGFWRKVIHLDELVCLRDGEIVFGQAYRQSKAIEVNWRRYDMVNKRREKEIRDANHLQATYFRMFLQQFCQEIRICWECLWYHAMRHRTPKQFLLQLMNGGECQGWKTRVTFQKGMINFI